MHCTRHPLVGLCCRHFHGQFQARDATCMACLLKETLEVNLKPRGGDVKSNFLSMYYKKMSVFKEIQFLFRIYVIKFIRCSKSVVALSLSGGKGN